MVAMVAVPAILTIMTFVLVHVGTAPPLPGERHFLILIVLARIAMLILLQLILSLHTWTALDHLSFEMLMALATQTVQEQQDQQEQQEQE